MMSIRFIRAAGLAAALLGCASPVQAQIVIDQNGDNELTAINSGNVTLQGSVSNPSINGGINNSAGNLTTQGASSVYSISDLSVGVSGEPDRTYSAHADGNHLNGTNSGTVTTNGKVSGGTWNGRDQSQSISATGMSNTISIKTVGRP